MDWTVWSRWAMKTRGSDSEYWTPETDVEWFYLMKAVLCSGRRQMLAPLYDQKLVNGCYQFMY